MQLENTSSKQSQGPRYVINGRENRNDTNKSVSLNHFFILAWLEETVYSPKPNKILHLFSIPGLIFFLKKQDKVNLF